MRVRFPLISDPDEKLRGPRGILFTEAEAQGFSSAYAALKRRSFTVGLRVFPSQVIELCSLTWGTLHAGSHTASEARDSFALTRR